MGDKAYSAINNNVYLFYHSAADPFTGIARRLSSVIVRVHVDYYGLADNITGPEAVRIDYHVSVAVIRKD